MQLCTILQDIVSASVPSGSITAELCYLQCTVALPSNEPCAITTLRKCCIISNGGLGIDIYITEQSIKVIKTAFLVDFPSFQFRNQVPSLWS